MNKKIFPLTLLLALNAHQSYSFAAWDNDDFFDDMVQDMQSHMSAMKAVHEEMKRAWQTNTQSITVDINESAHQLTVTFDGIENELQETFELFKENNLVIKTIYNEIISLKTENNDWETTLYISIDQETKKDASRTVMSGSYVQSIEHEVDFKQATVEFDKESKKLTVSAPYILPAAEEPVTTGIIKFIASPSQEAVSPHNDPKVG